MNLPTWKTLAQLLNAMSGTELFMQCYFDTVNWNCALRGFLLLCFAGTYIDKKCPFTGNVSIRGRILSGTCHSAKMNRTIIVRRDYLHYVKKYQRQVLIYLIHLNYCVEYSANLLLLLPLYFISFFGLATWLSTRNPRVVSCDSENVSTVL